MKLFAIAAALVSMLSLIPAQTQTPRSTGIRVRGHVTGIPAGAPAGLFGVRLNAAGVSRSVSIQANGDFEFTDVPPGRVRLIGDIAPTNGVSLTLENKDVDSVELAVRSPQVMGQVVLDDGRPLPTNRDPFQPVLELEALGNKGKTIAQQFMRSDGVFALLPTPPDDYTIRLKLVPEGYSVKSISFAGTDVTSTPLTLSGAPFPFLRITLTNAPAKLAPKEKAPAIAKIAPSTGDATLFVSRSGSAPGYFEGELHFFEIRSTGSDPFKEKKQLGPRFRDSLAFSLPAGTYEIHAYSLVCDGNCGRLGPPADECRTTFRIQSGETLYADRVQNQHVCSLAVSRERPGE